MGSISAPFVGPSLKIERARKHLAELVQLLTEAQQRLLDFYGDLDAIKLLAATQVGRVNYNQPTPPEFPLIVGDIVHNLRTALDIAMCDVARVRGKSTDKIKFPFAISSETLEKALTGDVKKLGDDIIELLRACEPHRKGNKALRALHDLDIDDKHKLILPADFFFTIGADNGHYTWSATPDLPIKVYTLMLDGPFEGEPVVPTMEALIELAEGIVEALALACGLSLGNEPATTPIFDDEFVEDMKGVAAIVRSGHQIPEGEIPGAPLETGGHPGFLLLF
jgi:hypothetical protein